LVSRAAWVAEADDVIRLVAYAAEALARCRRRFGLWHHSSADVAGRAFYLLFSFIAPNNAMTWELLYVLARFAKGKSKHGI